MLLNNFYTITQLEQDSNSLQAAIAFNAAHDIFKGHFPGQPVVPGVCMVQIVKEFMEKATGTPLVFRKGNQVKFLQLLVPAAGATVQVQISWQPEAGKYITRADFKRDTATVFKLDGVFEEQAVTSI